MEDQRGYVRAQANQYPEFLHPAWNKQHSDVHWTSEARDELYRLQLERIALLDGFEETRNGLVGVWLAHNAILKVKHAADGSLTGRGWKWEQGDWKAGCDYEFKGKVVNGVFRSEEKGKNPDTLERDHATLIVNRHDDAFARKRGQSKGEDDDADEPKCKRNMTNSSTARLFPARPSPDIDNLGDLDPMSRCGSRDCALPAHLLSYLRHRADDRTKRFRRCEDSAAMARLGQRRSVH